MQKNSVKKNFAYQMIYQILVLILPFITSPYIARVVGAEGLGVYSYSYSVAYYFVLFSLLGIQNYGNRTIAKVRENQKLLNEVFSNLVTVHGIISLICILIYIAYVVSLGEAKLYAAIQLLYVLSGLFDISWFYFGTENFKLTVTRNTIIKIINVICVFIFVKSQNDLWIYCLIMALGALVSQLTLWIPLHRYVKVVWPEWSKMKIHFKPLFVLFIPAVAISLYKYMDKIMIGSMSSKVQLGYYENAEKVINIPMTVISSFGMVMLPKMSNLAASHDKHSSQRYMALSVQFVMCLAIALTCGLGGIGNVFAPVFWGEEFIISGYLIMGLSVTIPFVSFANVIRTQYLIPNALDKEYLMSVIAGAIVNVGINSLLIPRQGAVGAMLGTIAAEIVVCIWQVATVRKQLPIMDFIKSFLPFVPGGIGMFIIVYFIGEQLGVSIRSLIVQIGVGGIIYVGYCIFYFYKSKNEIAMGICRNIKKHNIPKI